jgi:spore coat polysaccharide biosynthesis predicted glycosyltransferase SpsG
MRAIASGRLARTTGLRIFIKKPLSREQILFHVDVGQQEGWGHLRESLAVAEALRGRGFKPSFILPRNEEAGREVAQRGHTSSVFPESSWRNASMLEAGTDFLSLLRGNFLVTNLVSVPTEYGTQVAEVASGWAVITEKKEQEIAPLNFNISQFPEYMPLDEQYRNSPSHPLSEILNELLICFGGSDPWNAGGLVLELLRHSFENGRLSRNLHVRIVLGPLYEFADLIKATRDKYPVPLEILGPLSPAELASVARRSDLGIAAGGGTMYEFCALGLPCIVVPLIEKMRTNAAVLQSRDAVVLLPMLDQLTARELAKAIDDLRPSSRRLALSSAAQTTVDGQGAERMADRLIDQWNLNSSLAPEVVNE